MKDLPEILARLTRATDAWSGSITGPNRDEFTWPPQAPVEAYDFKTGQIVTLSPVLERDPAPHATVVERRDVPWRSSKWGLPIIVALPLLAILGTAYLEVHRAREGRRSDNASSPTQTSPTAAAEAVPSTSPTASSAPVLAESPLVPAALVESRRGNVKNRSERGRQPAPQATRAASGRAATEPPFGWFSLALPIQAQIFENGHFVGTSDGGRVMLPAGRHDLELVNESLRYRQWQSVEIRSGRATSPAIVLPAGKLHVNAIPWSEVLIDGERVGATPLGNLQLPIGAHRIDFRHPQLGELTRTAMIVAGTSTRVSVNFYK